MESMNKHTESLKAIQRALEQNNKFHSVKYKLDVDRNISKELKILEGNVRKKSTIIKIPSYTMYLQEYVNDFLQIYDTVSIIRKDEDYYWFKLEEVDI